MNLIKDFIAKNDVDTVANALSAEELLVMFQSISFTPGKQFLTFVADYSYLACEDVEFFGINASLKEKSSLFARTKMLVENYPETKGFYIVESRGDGYYVLTDKDDNIYNFFSGDSEKPEPTGEKLFDYILKRLSEATL